MTEHIFQLTARASDFVSRNRGQVLREELLAMERDVPADQRITIDATGVSVITPSFADEFFGRTAALLGIERFRQRFRIVGIAADAQVLINKVVRNRLLLNRQTVAE